ncbi:MAG: hypothetical protein E6Q97_36020 [Desulfurellales bacterium]|nr:MAG: hypothetical protein E6Q97_36020 [Desulfurellales bacterium]
MTPKCIITGCALRFAWMKGKYIWGDLHLCGNQFVLIATIDRAGGVVYHEDNDHHASAARGILLPSDAALIERRGVFVMPAKHEWLSARALAYLDLETLKQIGLAS